MTSRERAQAYLADCWRNIYDKFEPEETDRLEAEFEAVRAEERWRCALLARAMRGNPGPNYLPDVHDGPSWNKACERIENELRALNAAQEIKP